MSVRVARLSDLPQHMQDEALHQMERIFFESSATKRFASDGERTAFRERWLDRYLMHFPRFTYVALADISPTCAPIEGVVGYLVGCDEDPAHKALFADIGYFKVFRAMTPRYPAHLHINLDSRYRGRGIGKILIGAFIADLKAAGVSGAHVVTARSSRSVSFYAQCGFVEQGAYLPKGGIEVVFLARPLG